MLWAFFGHCKICCFKLLMQINKLQGVELAPLDSTTSDVCEGKRK